MRQPGEPSIEEILESIKQVIAREDRAGSLRELRAPEPEPEPEPEPVGGDVLDLGQRDYEAQPEPAVPLVTEDSSKAARGSLDALAGAVSSGAARREAEGSAAEALLRELLRPALAEWLDRNLPAIVERMVGAEIARITGQK
jgi:cell pole-organizing protein PopZ